MLTSKLNDLQYGFQKNKIWKMVSFTVQKARYYCIERESPLHVCYMDDNSAFDLVGIHGLIYKLFNFGVNGNMLRLIWNSFQDCSSRVLLNGHLSSAFRIEQGTRQGSVCAPFYHTVYVNALLEALTVRPTYLWSQASCTNSGWWHRSLIIIKTWIKWITSNML